MDFNKNYYEILGIDKNASEDDIKKAYRKLAHKHHPDKNQGDKSSESVFQNINEANQVLSDSKTRSEYDQRSPHGNSYSPFGGFGSSFGNGFEFHFGEGGDDFFSQIFGNGNPFGGFNPFNPFRRTEEFRENLDITLSVNINLKQIYLNELLNLKFKRFVSCDNCNGTGFDNKSRSDTCEICDGSGKDKYGKTCTYCKGDGKVYMGQCTTCKGEKVLLKDAEITLQNLSMLRSNIRNVQRGYGHQSKYYREKTGNLIVNVIIDRNDKYDVVNNHELHQTIEVHFQDAIDGSEILYSHIDDSKLKIKLPEKTKDGDVVKVKEKGLFINDTQRSDLYLKINIMIDYGRV